MVDGELVGQMQCMNAKLQQYNQHVGEIQTKLDLLISHISPPLAQNEPESHSNG